VDKSFIWVSLHILRWGSERVCCLLVLNSVTSTPQWIRQPKPCGVVYDNNKENAVGGHLRDLCYKESYPDIEEAPETVNVGGLSLVAKVKNLSAYPG
jgi:hypothetical protein